MVNSTDLTVRRVFQGVEMNYILRIKRIVYGLFTVTQRSHEVGSDIIPQDAKFTNKRRIVCLVSESFLEILVSMLIML